jgi:hypothetical protein
MGHIGTDQQAYFTASESMNQFQCGPVRDGEGGETARNGGIC